MKNSIEKLLTEITLPNAEHESCKILKKAFQNMDPEDFDLCLNILIMWPVVIKFGLPTDDTKGAKSFTDYYLLDETDPPRFDNLFLYCPDLSEIFVREDLKLKFNSKLSEEERQEIIDYIDKNHNIEFLD